MLSIQASGKGMWELTEDRAILTRVRENFLRNETVSPWITTNCNLTVGTQVIGRRHVMATGYCSIYMYEDRSVHWDNSVGMAVVWVGFSPKPTESRCAVN